MKLIYCFVIMICLSLSSKAQFAIKNSVLTGEWKLISLKGDYDTYEYDCEKKKFHMSSDMLFSFGESAAESFEKDIIKLAEKSLFRLKENGNYELSLGTSDIEKGTWKSQAVKETEEGYIPDRFGSLVLISGSDTFTVFVSIEGEQLLLKFTTESKAEPIDKEFVFRKDFKGSVFNNVAKQPVTNKTTATTDIKLTKMETVAYLNKKYKEAEGLIPLGNEKVTVKNCHIEFINGLLIVSRTLFEQDKLYGWVEFKFNPLYISEIRQNTSADASISKGGLTDLEITVTSKSIIRTLKFSDREQVTNILDSFRLDFLFGDGNNFEKIKKALLHLQALLKEEDDPF